MRCVVVLYAILGAGPELKDVPCLGLLTLRVQHLSRTGATCGGTHACFCGMQGKGVVLEHCVCHCANTIGHTPTAQI